MQTKAAGVGRENVSTVLKTISPKPIITRVLQSWHVTPGMIFAVAEDAQRQVWIVESTPVGTHCWTVEQARELPQGIRTGRVLREAIRLGYRLQAEYAIGIAAEELKMPDMLPHFAQDADGAVAEADEAEAPQKRSRLAQRIPAKEPVCA